MVATMTKLTSRPMGGERGDKGGHGGWGGGARESATVLLPGSQRGMEWNTPRYSELCCRSYDLYVTPASPRTEPTSVSDVLRTAHSLHVMDTHTAGHDRVLAAAMMMMTMTAAQAKAKVGVLQQPLGLLAAAAARLQKVWIGGARVRPPAAGCARRRPPSARTSTGTGTSTSR